ncbi:hypothetical protein MPSEU_000779700 [Mayamaea pseudoterrestris]|nr:hypothetical protein MPSEU_000779700 [Mayamaea pseudoterrestris]
MEELQDAIEDAQYVNAIATQDDGPRPVVAWEKPTDEQLQQWIATKQPKLDSMDWVLSHAIGYFLFSQYVKKERDEYTRMVFCEEVQRLLKLPDKARVGKATFILAQFLQVTRSNSDEALPSSVKTEIIETDLTRPIPLKQVSEKEIQKLIDMSMDWPSCSESLIGLKGPLLKEFKQDFVDAETQNEIWVKRESVRGCGEARTSLSYHALSVPIPPDGSPAVSDQTLPTSVDGDGSSSSISYNGNAPAFVNDKTEAAVTAQTVASHQSRTYAASMHEVAGRKGGQHVKNNINMQQSIGELLFMDAERVVMESLKRDYWDDFKASEHFIKFRNFLWYQDRRVKPDDFYTMRVLGRGGFGLVYASKKGTSGKLYAMKVMNKRRIKMKKSEQLATNERQALGDVDSLFVVNLIYSFHSKDDVYLILDLMTGGDLAYHLQIKGRFSKKECLYYAARIMFGLQDLHNAGYVYRDMKPENCLLSEDGRVKITDLGLAVKLVPDLHGAAGTRGYWAPEMLRRDNTGKRKTYGQCVDWFSFGCCVAEFISGTNPFRTEEALQFGMDKGKPTKEKAIDCATLEMDPVFKSEKYEPDAADFCRRLLDKNENTRLGANGCEEIKAHPWFKHTNWESILADSQLPPFLPPKDVNAASQSEIGQFALDKQYQETTLDDKDELVYKDWDWTNPQAFGAEVIEFLMYERQTGRPLLPMSQAGGCCVIL